MSLLFVLLKIAWTFCIYSMAAQGEKNKKRRGGVMHLRFFEKSNQLKYSIFIYYFF